MFGSGFFAGSASNSVSGSGNASIEVEDGKIIFKPSDPLYIDKNNNVFLDNKNRNAVLSYQNGQLFAEKVI